MPVAQEAATESSANIGPPPPPTTKSDQKMQFTNPRLRMGTAGAWQYLSAPLKGNKKTSSDNQDDRNYYHQCKLLLSPLLLLLLLCMALQGGAERAHGAELKQSPSVQKRYLIMDSPDAAISSEHHQPVAEQQPNEQRHQQQPMMSFAMANGILHNKNQQQQQQRSLWTQESSALFNQQPQQQQPQHPAASQDQFVSYQHRPATMLDAASTMPSINRQIQPPNPFYELSFAPTNTLQLEHQQHDRHMHHHQLDEQEPHFASAMSQPSPVRLEPPQQQQQQQQHHHSAGSTTARSIELPQQQHQQQSEVGGIQMTPESAPTDNKGGESARNSQQQQEQQQQQQQQLQPVDKIEPRQRRRLFNRILKKAEWNHLFVELSKVFLRYFLDLALKDIIGKQSGSSVGGSGSSSAETTSRKKLDAQSELADLLKEFVKNAISNI